MIAGRILKPLSTKSLNPLAISLIKDLGMVDALRQVSSDGTQGGGNSTDKDKSLQLASELVGLLDS